MGGCGVIRILGTDARAHRQSRVKLGCGVAQKMAKQTLIADDNYAQLLAQFQDLRTRLDELQQEFMRTTDLDERVLLTLEMQELIGQADSVVRSLTQRSEKSLKLEDFRSRKSPGISS